MGRVAYGPRRCDDLLQAWALRVQRPDHVLDADIRLLHLDLRDDLHGPAGDFSRGEAPGRSGTVGGSATSSWMIVAPGNRARLASQQKGSRGAQPIHVDNRPAVFGKPRRVGSPRPASAHGPRSPRGRRTGV